MTGVQTCALPIYGYAPLMPGEKRSITTELRDADTRGEKPRIVVEGFNVTAAEK